MGPARSREWDFMWALMYVLIMSRSFLRDYIFLNVFFSLTKEDKRILVFFCTEEFFSVYFQEKVDFSSFLKRFCHLEGYVHLFIFKSTFHPIW